MPRPSLPELLGQLLSWVERTQRMVEGRSLDDVLSDETLQLAITHCVEGVGESSRRIMQKYPDVLVRWPELPLAEAYQMRNRLTHWYETVTFEVVWETAIRDIPLLGDQVRTIVDHEARG